MRNLLLALSLALLATACAHSAHPSRPLPAVVHPQLALDEPGAVAVAQNYAWQRGLRSEVKKVSRDHDRWLVDLKIMGKTKGKLQLAVDATSGGVLVLKEELRPHDQGNHGDQDGDRGDGKGHGDAAEQGRGWGRDHEGDDGHGKDDKHEAKKAGHDGKHKGEGKKGDKD